VADRIEAGRPPGGKKFVRLAPAVETDAEAVRFEHAVDFGKGWLQPGRVVVVGDAAALAVVVPDEVRRIGQHEIDTALGQVFEHLRAIAVDDAIAELRN
jgi:hypothetical protein